MAAQSHTPGGAHNRPGDIPTAGEDRIAGVLVGAAVGDALGAPYEFMIPGPTDPRMAGGGVGPWEPGEWTDDTQLTICVAEAAAAGELSATGVGRRFLDWFAAKPKDVGHQTRTVLEAARSADELAGIASELFAARPHGSAGNGSLMRTAAVALALRGDDEAMVRTARAISDLTHADPLCGDACVLWCVAIARAIAGDDTGGIEQGIDYLPAESRGRWVTAIARARDFPPDHFVPNGFVVSAFQAALSAVHRADDFAGGIRAAIGAGHDTDTVGAIAGALMGARFGLSAIPLAWLEPLHGSPGLDARSLSALALEAAGVM